MNDPAAVATLLVVGLAWVMWQGWERLMDDRKRLPLEFGDSVDNARLGRYGEARIMKIYGEDADDALPKPFEFGLVTKNLRTGEMVTHMFTAVTALDQVQVSMVLDNPDGLDWGDWFGILGSTLSDTDGDVPESWRFEPRQPTEEEREALDLSEDRLVYDPPGERGVEVVPEGDAPVLWTDDLKRWTSRRLFLHVYRQPTMKVMGGLDTLRSLTKDLVQASADRPTDES